MTEVEPQDVTITVDGVPVQVEAGSPVIEAAARAGVIVPHYCYHPGIPSRPAQCRSCLVAVEGQAKLQPSCVLPAADGMVVHTDSDEVREAHRAVIEFLLLNHPLDCPICDAAGQCMLQDYAFETGQLESRYLEEKSVLGRDRIADDILYFADRCIICTRCVRFMSDVAGDNALVVAQRGDKAYIDTFPGEKLEHPFRGNIVDVCPVGALVHEDSLFKARAWDMDSVAGVCPGCSMGCNVTLDTKENAIVRLKPRFNGEVNSYWMCDYGRKQGQDRPGVRAEVPLLREDEAYLPVSWSRAIEWLCERLRPGMGGDAFASASASNEALFFFRRLLDWVGIEGGRYRVEVGDEAALSPTSKLKLRADRAPNGVGAELTGFVRLQEGALPPVNGAAFVLSSGTEEPPAGFGEQAKPLVFLGTHLTVSARRADLVLPITSFAEMDGSFTNFEGRVQRFHRALEPAGIARPAWMVLSGVLSRLGAGPRTLDVRAAFGEMAAALAGAEQGLTWESLGLKGTRLPDGTGAATACSGADR